VFNRLYSLIYCIFERHDILGLKLTYQIEDLEPISNQNLIEYLGDNKDEHLNNLSALFYDAKITDHNFMKIRNYCKQVLQQFLEIHSYDLIQ